MSDPAPAVTTGKKKRRRWIRVLRVGLVLLVVAVLIGPLVLSKTRLRDRVINQAVRSPNVTASSQGASFGWFSPLSVQGLDLNSEKRSVRVRVNDIATEQPWWRLLARLPDLGTVRLEKPHIEVMLPFEDLSDEPAHQLPLVTGAVKGGALTVRFPDLSDPVIDVQDVDLTFHVADGDGGRVLTVDPAVLFEKWKLTPQLCDKLLHMIAPTFGEASRISGEISLALDKFRLPVGGPRDRAVRRLEMEGKLTLHQVTTDTRGPLMGVLVKVLADVYGKQPSEIVRAVQDDTVHFRVADGRLHHDGFRISFPDISPDLKITSSGSIGIDETLDLKIELPRIDKAKYKEKGPIHCHVTGTVRKPVMAVRDASLLVRLPERKTPFVVVDGLDLKIRVERGPNGPVLTVDPVTAIENRKLSPETIDQILTLIDPTLGELPQVSGEVSLAVERVRIPLGDPVEQIATHTEVEGTFT